MAGSTGPHRRDVRRSNLFISKAMEIQPNAPRLEAQLHGVEDAIARAAEAFPPIPNTILRLVKTDPFPGAPRLRIVFNIDNAYMCTMQWIELMEGPAPPL